MLLAADVGNTEITLGLFAGDRLLAHWRLTTDVSRTPDEWAAMLTSFLTHAGHSTHEVRAAVEASVAPGVTEVLAEGVELALGLRPVAIGPDSALDITLDVEEPHSVGADRVVNTVAAAALYGRDTIVVDFGTATTFDCITKDGTFLGGVIAPGVRTADSVDGIVRRIKEEWPTGDIPQVVATGGLADVVAPLCKEIEMVEPQLTLLGLKVAASRLGLKW